MGFERKRSPLLIEKLFFLILQAHVTKICPLEFKSAIAVTRDGLEEVKKNVGQYVVELEIILWAVMFCFPSFFLLFLVVY